MGELQGDACERHAPLLLAHVAAAGGGAAGVARHRGDVVGDGDAPHLATAHLDAPHLLLTKAHRCCESGVIGIGLLLRGGLCLLLLLLLLGNSLGLLLLLLLPSLGSRAGLEQGVREGGVGAERLQLRGGEVGQGGHVLPRLRLHLRRLRLHDVRLGLGLLVGVRLSLRLLRLAEGVDVALRDRPSAASLLLGLVGGSGHRLLQLRLLEHGLNGLRCGHGAGGCGLLLGLGQGMGLLEGLGATHLLRLLLLGLLVRLHNLRGGSHGQLLLLLLLLHSGVPSKLLLLLLLHARVLVLGRGPVQGGDGGVVEGLLLPLARALLLHRRGHLLLLKHVGHGRAGLSLSHANLGRLRGGEGTSDNKNRTRLEQDTMSRAR